MEHFIEIQTGYAQGQKVWSIIALSEIEEVRSNPGGGISVMTKSGREIKSSYDTIDSVRRKLGYINVPEDR